MTLAGNQINSLLAIFCYGKQITKMFNKSANRIPCLYFFFDRLQRFSELFLWLGISVSMALTVIMFWMGGIGNRLFELPDSERFLAAFFQEPFVIIISLYIAWYVSSFKYSYSRMDEYKFLNSLPISAKYICDRFIWQDLWRYSWIPALVIFLYFSLLRVTHISHLCRLSILTISMFILVIIANTSLHIIASLRINKLRKYVYPSRANPMIIAAIILGYAISQLLFVIIPQLVSGYLFWIVFFLLQLINYVLLTFARTLFLKWQTENLAFQMWENKIIKFGLSWFQISNHIRLCSKLNPFLLKNLLKIQREKNILPLILTTLFVILAYLVSMNNKNIEDSLTVLFAISCFYSFLFAYRSINQFSPNEESPELIYSLPLKKSSVYFSVFIPAYVWLAIVMTVFTILILISGSTVILAGLFWQKSLLAGLMLLFTAFNYAIASYPDIKQAQKYFMYWVLTLIVLAAVFYKYHIIIVSLMILWSFFQLRKLRFYRFE